MAGEVSAFSLTDKSMATPPVNKALWVPGLLKKERLRILSAKNHPAKMPGRCRNFRGQQSTDLGRTVSEGAEGVAGNAQLEKLRGEQPEKCSHNEEGVSPNRLAKFTRLLVVGVETRGQFCSITKIKSHPPYHPAMPPLRFTQI